MYSILHFFWQFYQLDASNKQSVRVRLASNLNKIMLNKDFSVSSIVTYITGACPGFLKGGGPISLGSLKKGHQILKGGGPIV